MTLLYSLAICPETNGGHNLVIAGAVLPNDATVVIECTSCHETARPGMEEFVMNGSRFLQRLLEAVAQTAKEER